MTTMNRELADHMIAGILECDPNVDLPLKTKLSRRKISCCFGLTSSSTERKKASQGCIVVFCTAAYCRPFWPILDQAEFIGGS
jgi:hypothetical protein